MTDELLERVRAVDPLPAGSTAPPFAFVYARRQRRAARWSHRLSTRLPSLLVGGAGVAVSLGVLIAAVLLVHVRPHPHPGRALAGGGRSHTSDPVPAIPASGMPGIVTVWGAGIEADGDGMISLEQCLGCRPSGNQTAKAIDHDWLVTTRDGGRTWSVSPVDYALIDPVLAGASGWANGMQLLDRRQAGTIAVYEPGVFRPGYYVTHDAGSRWNIAPTTVGNAAPKNPSIADAEVWAVSGGPATVLHGSASGGRLVPTAAQPPIHSGTANMPIAAAGPGRAYVLALENPHLMFVTPDDGRHWTRLTSPPCTGRSAFSSLDGASGPTVYVTCSSDRGSPQLVRSLDGGQSWLPVSVDWGFGGPRQVTVTSRLDAWAFDTSNDLLRTTDAGRNWHIVWSPDDPRVAPLSRPITMTTVSALPLLSAISATSASIVTLLNRETRTRPGEGTNLVTYRTTDGGERWRTFVVPLGSSPP